jgi:hypothetical protein
MVPKVNVTTGTLNYATLMSTGTFVTLVKVKRNVVSAVMAQREGATTGALILNIGARWK